MSAKPITWICGAKIRKKTHMHKCYAIFLFSGRGRAATV